MSKCIWQLYVDGASRNNPGDAGAGFHLEREGETVTQGGIFLGVKTNNQAEYMGLLLGLHFAQKHLKQDDCLLIKADSELMIRQLSGIYKVKNLQLKELFDKAQIYLGSLDYRVQHIPREENVIADKLANRAIDKKYKIPTDLAGIVTR